MFPALIFSFSIKASTECKEKESVVEDESNSAKRSRILRNYDLPTIECALESFLRQHPEGKFVGEKESNSAMVDLEKLLQTRPEEGKEESVVEDGLNLAKPSSILRGIEEFLQERKKERTEGREEKLYENNLSELLEKKRLEFIRENGIESNPTNYASYISNLMKCREEMYPSEFFVKNALASYFKARIMGEKEEFCVHLHGKINLGESIIAIALKSHLEQHIELEKEEPLELFFGRALDLNSPESPQPNTEGDEEEFYVQDGLKLAKSIIKRNPEVFDYKGERTLILGEGHITEPSKLIEGYTAEGGVCLTTSLLDGGLDFHQNKGFYTASAENDPHFNSDWIGNFLKKSHRKTLFITDFFNIIFDATYTPQAFSLDVFEDIAGSLQKGGTYIMQLPLAQDSDTFKTGHSTPSHSVLWFNGKLTFPTLEDVESHWRSFLLSKGFSEVTLEKSPLSFALGDLGIDSLRFSQLSEGDAKKLSSSQFQDKLCKYSKASKVYQLNPDLGHYNLSNYYLIAKK